MTRPSLADYAGATTLLTPEAGLELDDARFAWSPKIDGCYAQISTDGAGRIASVLSRAGSSIPDGAPLLGVHAAPPFSTLIGELTAHTEAGIAEAARVGYVRCHLFDAVRVDGRYLARAPYWQRHGALYAAQSWVESEGRARDRSVLLDAQGAAHGAMGRYTRHAPRDLRRLPVVPLIRGRTAARELWRTAVELGGAEGLVACRLDAPIGARHSKRKIKLVDTLDAVVTAADNAAITVRVLDLELCGLTFSLAGRAPVGAVVEIGHHGWFSSSPVPRFPRLVRRRIDVVVSVS